MKHTVILGSYNRPQYVVTAMRSVIAQTRGDWQLIVTDDGSNAATLEAIRLAYPPDAIRCLLLTNDDPSPDVRPDASVRAVKRINLAIPFAYGDLIHYLADDDFYHPQAFETFDQLFADPKVMVGYGRLVYVDDHGTPTGPQRYFPGPVADPYCVLDHNQVAHRRACFEKVPVWDPTETGDYASDGRFFRALCRAYGPAYGIDRIVGYKRQHAHNLQATREQTTATRE